VPVSHPSGAPSRGRIWTVLGALYFVWGTTYLGIYEVNRTIPPLIGAGFRFVVAGGLLYALARVRAGEHPRLRQWRGAAIVGAFLLLGGNGGVAWAQYLGVPTGVTSLLIALIPMWLALIDRVVLRSGPIGWRVSVGLLAGFGGEALLVGSAATEGDVPLDGMLVAVTASLAWAVGSLYARTAPLPRAPLLGSGMQQLAGSGVILAVAAATGAFGELDVGAIAPRSWLGLLWLILAGSFVGFSAYLWLLRNVRTSLVSTYAYVNPIVAVFLGWLVLGEQLTGRTYLAAAVVLSGVALIISAGSASRRGAGEPAAGEPALPAQEASDAGEQRRPQVEGEI
jgi:drug/metabolite transporter (DMT)-like permease